VTLTRRETAERPAELRRLPGASSTTRKASQGRSGPFSGPNEVIVVPGRTDLHPRGIRKVRIRAGLPKLSDLVAEIEEMVDVLLGRTPPPLRGRGLLTLLEVATAYKARALEIQLLLHEAERAGRVARGSQLYRFRTGELRDFLDIATGAQELGSRRITARQVELEEMKYERTD
jgi:hypothetical protein